MSADLNSTPPRPPSLAGAFLLGLVMMGLFAGVTAGLWWLGAAGGR